MSNFFVKKNIFEKALPYYIDFVIPGFEKSYPGGLFKCPSFTNQPSDKWFLSFVDKIENAMGKNFLPIYRMGDGEFQICVGYRYRYRKESEPMWHYLLGLLRAIALHYIKKITRARFVPTTTRDSLGGDYAASELKFLRAKLQQQIGFIAEKGILSPAFSCRKDHIHAQQYIQPMTRWFRAASIRFDEKNYIPVYFIYAMLTGPYRHQIYKNRRVLVITSFDDNKRDTITAGLKKEGVADVQFISISRGRSMYDTIDLSLIGRPVDLVLIGGGIGASNILCQLESLNTVAIDVGYIIECLADSERKKKRTFCWPDEERDGDYRPI